MTVVDSLGIKGMKQSDFKQLEKMFNYVLNKNVRWDRKDYWDSINERLKNWFEEVNEQLQKVKIKELK